MVATPKPIERENVGALAKRHLEENNNDKHAALSSALREVKSDPELLDCVLTEVLSSAISHSLMWELKEQRERSISLAAGNAVASAGRISADAQQRARKEIDALLEFPMQSGVFLRDARRPEIRETSDFYLKTGKTNIERGLWLKSIADKLPDDRKRAGRALKAKEIRDLLVNARKKAERIAS